MCGFPKTVSLSDLDCGGVRTSPRAPLSTTIVMHRPHCLDTICGDRQSALLTPFVASRDEATEPWVGNRTVTWSSTDDALSIMVFKGLFKVSMLKILLAVSGLRCQCAETHYFFPSVWRDFNYHSSIICQYGELQLDIPSVWRAQLQPRLLSISPAQ